MRRFILVVCGSIRLAALVGAAHANISVVSRLGNVPSNISGANTQKKLGGKASYEANLARLVRFIGEHGHSDVPRDGSAFGRWFAGIRHAARSGQLAPEKRAALVDAGATFRPLEGRWEEGLRLLEQYIAREGTADVPKQHVEEGICLWAWLHQQRREARAQKLSEWKQRTLASLGVAGLAVGEEARARRFERNMAALHAFKRREGHANVPRSHVELTDGPSVKLGAFVATQRTKAMNRKLDPTTAARLQEAGVRLGPSQAVRIGPSTVREARKKRGRKYWKFLASAR